MNNKFLIAILLAAILSGCASPSPDSPVSSDSPSEPIQSEYLPSPADGSLLRSEAYLDSAELLTLESFPLQFMLTLKGNLPTPCHNLRIAASPPDSDNKIVVDVYSVASSDAICVQALEPFEVNFPLGSFPIGTYMLYVNGELVAEFQS
jgi:hypothetical protein